MSHIVVKNGHFEGSPTAGGRYSDYRPPVLRGDSKLTLWRCARFVGTNLVSPLPMSHILGKNGQTGGSPTVGGFQSYLIHPQLRGSSNSLFLRFCAISKN